MLNEIECNKKLKITTKVESNNRMLNYRQRQNNKNIEDTRSLRKVLHLKYRSGEGSATMSAVFSVDRAFSFDRLHAPRACFKL